MMTTNHDGTIREIRYQLAAGNLTGATELAPQACGRVAPTASAGTLSTDGQTSGTPVPAGIASARPPS